MTITSPVDNTGELFADGGTLTVKGAVTGDGKVLAGAGGVVDFSGVGNDLAGVLGGSGTIAFTGGSDILAGQTMSTGILLISGAAVSVSGSVSVSNTVQITAETFDVEKGGTLSGAAVQFSGGTLVNGGEIDGGAGGVAVSLSPSSATLAVLAGAHFVGKVNGDGGTLELVSGTGVISGLFADNDVTVSGSMPTTTFDNFNTVEIEAGATFTLTGNAAIATEERLIDDGTLTVADTLTNDGSLIDDGTLTVAGTLTNDGSLTIAGTLAGTGTLAITPGMMSFDAGASLKIADVHESGATTRATVAETDLSYAGDWSQSDGTLTVASGDTATFSGTNSFSGTLSGAGTVAFDGGSDTLSGATLTATNAVVSGATLTLSGAIALTDTLVATSPEIIVGAGGATLSGGGRLELTDASTNTVVGATATATLTNQDVIFGAGQLGNGTMTLDNGVKGIIEGDDATALAINTGGATVINAGEIAAVTGITIMSPLDNTGVLFAVGGTLTVKGAVTGGGKVEISSGTADLASTFSEAVDFTGTTGVLELGSSKTYTGAISGFSLTGMTSLDLLDIPFAGVATGVYTGTTTSGVLTVIQGASVARIHLVGDYLSSAFMIASDGHGGSTVFDPVKALGAPHSASMTVSPGAPSSRAQFVQAMAAFTPTARLGDVGTVTQGSSEPILVTPMLAHAA